MNLLILAAGKARFPSCCFNSLEGNGINLPE